MGPIDEVRLIVYAVVGIGSLLGASAGGAKLSSMHYEAVISKQQVAQDAVVEQKQQQIIDLQKERSKLEDQVRKDHDTMVQADTAARTAVTASLHNAENAIRAITVLRPVANSGLPAGSAPGAGGDRELEQAIADANAAITSVNGAIEQTIASCQHDSTELVNILALAPKPKAAAPASLF